MMSVIDESLDMKRTFHFIWTEIFLKNMAEGYTVNNVIWNLYIVLKSVLKMLEMPFQRPQIQNIYRGIGHDMPRV